jgi:hypothetical protein
VKWRIVKCDCGHSVQFAPQYRRMWLWWNCGPTYHTPSQAVDYIMTRQYAKAVDGQVVWQEDDA